MSFLTIAEENPGRLHRGIAVIVSFVLAWLTYATIERQLRFSQKRSTLVFLITTCSALLIAGASAWQLLIKPRNDNPELQPIMDAISDWEFPPRGFEKRNIKGETFWTNSDDRMGDHIMFIGDSHMEQYSERIRKISTTIPRKARITFATKNGCRPIHKIRFLHSDWRCKKFMDTAREYAMTDEIDTVVFAGSWNEYFTSIRESEFLYFDEAGNKLFHKRNDAIDPFLTDILRFIGVVAKKKPVFLILDNPVDDMFDPKRQISSYAGEFATFIDVVFL